MQPTPFTKCGEGIFIPFCLKTELITLDLICPSTYQLLWNSSGDSGPDLSFNKSASLKHLFGLARASLVAVSKLYFSFECSEADYTSSCPPSLIELTVTLFKVFQTLCKQGDWFSFAKRRAPSSADVCRLMLMVIKLRISLGLLDLSGLIRVLKNRLIGPERSSRLLDVRPTLSKASLLLYPPAAADAVIRNPTSEDLVVDSRGKGIMVDDAAAPSGGASRQRPSSGPAPLFRDVSGDAIHTDFFPFFAGPYYATYPEDGVAGNYYVDSLHHTRIEWLERGLSDDQINYKDESLHCMEWKSHGGEILAHYHGLNQSHHEYVLSTDSRLKGYEEKVAGLTGLELQVSTLKKGRRRIKSLSKSLDNLHYEVARLFAALNQATILEAERDEEILHLNATPPEFSSFFRGQFQGLVWKFLASDEFSRVQGELMSLSASVGFERGLSMHRTKDEFADISEYAAEPLSVILHLEPEKLVRPANVPIPRDTRVSSPIAKESTVTPVSKSLKLFDNVAHVSTVGWHSEQNEEQVKCCG
ncbi:hypothetical protein Tco_0785391 [Tanacetum coccineum]